MSRVRNAGSIRTLCDALVYLAQKNLQYRVILWMSHCTAMKQDCSQKCLQGWIF